MQPRVLEICAGAGGQALGLERAGLLHDALFGIGPHACATLRTNRLHQSVHETDAAEWMRSHAADRLAGASPALRANRTFNSLSQHDLTCVLDVATIAERNPHGC